MDYTTTIYVTDADNRELLEYDGGTGQILRRYVYGNGIDEALSQIEISNTSGSRPRATLIPDIQGSTIAALDSTSAALTKTAYKSFGETNTSTGSYRYTGRRIDAESGLYYYRARMYDPTRGRFLQPDPIGYAGGANLYAYVGNDPLNLVDPSGLWSLDVNAGILGVSIGIGENSGALFGSVRVGLFGPGITYDPSADVPKGASGNYPGECTYCSVSRVYWETAKANAGIVLGPVNATLLQKQGSTLVNEYDRSGNFSGSIGIPGTPTKFDPKISARLDKEWGVSVDVGAYVEAGISFPWAPLRDAVGSALGFSSPAAASPSPAQSTFSIGGGGYSGGGYSSSTYSGK